jgi:hypothetical protein
LNAITTRTNSARLPSTSRGSTIGPVSICRAATAWSHDGTPLDLREPLGRTMEHVRRQLHHLDHRFGVAVDAGR